MYVSLRASEVSAYIGKNKFKPVAEVLDSLLKRHGVAVKTKEDEVVRILSQSSAARDLVSQVQLQRPACSADVMSVFNNAIQGLEKLEIDASAKASLIDSVRENLYTSHGVRKEAGTADQTHLDLAEDHTMYRIPLCTLGKNVYTLFGKIDRIETTADGGKVLVEIKNRTKKLFYKVYPEEMIQVQTYLEMLDMEEAKLIEQCNSEINIMKVTRDQEFWNEVILPGLLGFCEAAQERFVAQAAVKTGHSSSGP